MEFRQDHSLPNQMTGIAFRKDLVMVLLVVSLGLLSGGCPKKSVMMGDSSLMKAEKMAAAERERVTKLEVEEKEREARELARLKEEAAKTALTEKQLEAERERAARLEEERAIKETELKARQVEARKVLAREELEVERERVARLEAERAVRDRELKAKELETKRALAEKQKEFEKTLIAKKHPGIEGEIFETPQFKDVYFDFDKYDIRPDDIRALEQTAALLLEYSNVKVQIEGHCDERGTQEYNLALGQRRVNSVKQYLISLGIVPDRISTISYGEEIPADPSHTEEAYAKNRRAHFIILSK